MTARAMSSAHVSRIKALREKHAFLSDTIEKMQGRPSTTDFYLRQLKKQKLMLKEEIEGIRAKKAATA